MRHAALLTACGGSIAHAAPAVQPGDSVRHVLVLDGESTGELSFAVKHIHHELIGTTDPKMGVPTGAREHKPFAITKRTDETSALLLTSLINSEQFITVTLTSYRTRGGTEMVYHTTSLARAALVGRRLEWDASNPTSEREHLSFAYESIAWEWPVLARIAADTIPGAR